VNAHDFPFADQSDGPIPATLIKYDRSDNWEKGWFLSAVLSEDKTRPVVWIDDMCRLPTVSKLRRPAYESPCLGPDRAWKQRLPLRANVAYALRPGPTLVVKPCYQGGLLPIDLSIIEAFLRLPHELPFGAGMIEDPTHWARPDEDEEFKVWLATNTARVSGPGRDT